MLATPVSGMASTLPVRRRRRPMLTHVTERHAANEACHAAGTLRPLRRERTDSAVGCNNWRRLLRLLRGHGGAPLLQMMKGLSSVAAVERRVELVASFVACWVS